MFTPLDTACANILDYSSKYFCDYSDYSIIPITLPSAPKGLQVTLSLRLGGPGGGPWPLLATPPAGAEPLAGFWSAGVGLAGACTCAHHGLSSAPPVWWLVTCAGGAGAWLTVPALCSLPCLPGAGGWPSPAHEGRYIVVHCDSTQGGSAWAVPGRCSGLGIVCRISSPQSQHKQCRQSGQRMRGRDST